MELDVEIPSDEAMDEIVVISVDETSVVEVTVSEV